jgi:hypothetical protein
VTLASFCSPVRPSLQTSPTIATPTALHRGPTLVRPRKDSLTGPIWKGYPTQGQKPSRSRGGALIRGDGRVDNCGHWPPRRRVRHTLTMERDVAGEMSRPPRGREVSPPNTGRPTIRCVWSSSCVRYGIDSRRTLDRPVSLHRKQGESPRIKTWDESGNFDRRTLPNTRYQVRGKPTKAAVSVGSCTSSARTPVSDWGTPDVGISVCDSAGPWPAEPHDFSPKRVRETPLIHSIAAVPDHGFGTAARTVDTVTPANACQQIRGATLRDERAE